MMMMMMMIIIIESIVPLGTYVVYEFFPLLSISFQQPQFVPVSTRFLDDRYSPAILRSSRLLEGSIIAPLLIFPDPLFSMCDQSI